MVAPKEEKDVFLFFLILKHCCEAINSYCSSSTRLLKDKYSMMLAKKY
jgi:hypothetical protein